MTKADKLKFLTAKLKQTNLNTCVIETMLKYLQNQVVNETNTNI